MAILLRYSVFFGLTLFSIFGMKAQDTLLAHTAFQKAHSLMRANQWDSAIIHGHEAMELFEEAAHRHPAIWKRAIDIERRLWSYYRDNGQYREALDSTLLLLQLAEVRLGLKHPLIGTVHQDIGIGYFYLGNYSEAIAHYELASNIRLMHLGKPDRKTAQLYQNIGLTWLQLGKTEKALEYFEEALELRKSFDELESLAVSTLYMNIAWGMTNLSKLDSAHAYYDRAIDLRLQLIERSDIDLGQAYSNKAGVYWKQGNLKKAIEYYEKGLKIYQEKLRPDHPMFVQAFNSFGNIYKERGDQQTALSYYEKAVQVGIKSLGKMHPNLMYLYHNMGVIFQYNDDLDQAELYLQEAIDIGKETLGEDHPDVIFMKMNKGSVYQQRKQYEKAELLLREGIAQLIKSSNQHNPRLATSYVLLGDVLEAKGDLHGARMLFQKAFDFSQKHLHPEHPEYSGSLKALGDIYKKLDMYDAAMDAYQKALDIRIRTFGDRHPGVANVWNAIGEVYALRGDTQQAMSSYQAAMWANTFSDTDREKEAGFPPISSISRPQTLLQSCRLQAASLRLSGRLDNLQKADTTFQYMLDLVEEIRKNYLHKNSGLSLQDTIFPMYEAALETVLSLAKETGDSSYTDRAFAISERSKAINLRSSLQEGSARRFAGIPEEILLKEHELKVDLAYYERMLYEQRAEDDSTSKLWRTKLFLTKTAFDSLQAVMIQEFPAYYQLRYAQLTTQRQDVQSYLATRKAALIEYVLGEDQVFIFLIQPDSYAVWSQAYERDLFEQVQQFRQQILDLNASIASPIQHQAELIQSAHRLYQQLFASVHSKLESSVSSLIIVPDSYLGYVPFGLLISDSTRPAEIAYPRLPYLFRSYPISYAPSSSLLIKSQIPAASLPPKGIGGFAPSYEMRRRLQGDSSLSSRRLDRDMLTDILPLPGAEQEVAEVTQIWNGDTYIGPSASERIFKEKAPLYQILHLSMHAFLEDSNSLYSHLRFEEIGDSTEDGSLHISELYNMSLNAELAVLSACNTGFGEFSRGEGIMSLSSAFAYAGVPSTVMTLWPVPDRASRALMTKFHHYLKKGYSKQDALHQARIAYLEEELSLEKTHPFYWAGFVLNGNIDPIQSNRENRALRFLLICLVLLLPPLIVLGRFYQKGRANR
ncbi:MAG: tetratricopeptide repeat protein [Bacteroidota bacterium]